MKTNKKLIKLLINALNNMAIDFKKEGDFDLMDMCHRRIREFQAQLKKRT